MKLIPMESMPSKRIKHGLQDLITEFVNSEAKIVKIDFNERDYKSARVCYSCFWVAVKRLGYPVKVHVRGEEVFLRKLTAKG